jgi:hypothetical protein
MRYEIRLAGLLGADWADMFGVPDLILEGSEDTLLVCTIPDQAALFGILKKVRDLGIPLLSVKQIETGDET